MHERTALTLERLRQADWFANVGTPVRPDVVAVHSWEEAVASGAKPDWENLRLEIKNRESGRVRQHFGDEAFPWNDLVREIRPQTVAMTNERLNALGLSDLARKVVYAGASWDTLGACLETEYSDIVACDFYRRLLEWYLAGHWPCGWEGEYPAGKLVVF